MNEEKKTYSFTGTVTIGTDEYRDLIETAVRLDAELSDKRSAYYRIFSEKQELEKKGKAFEAKLNEVFEFIKSHNLDIEYKAWKLERVGND